MKRPVEEAVADLLNQSLTIEPQPRVSVSVGSGEEYEVIGVGIDLPPRSPCPRGNISIYKIKNYCTIIAEHIRIIIHKNVNYFNKRFIITLGAPLTQEQWEKYKDSAGRINNPEAVKEIIFRGVYISIFCSINILNVK